MSARHRRPTRRAMLRTAVASLALTASGVGALAATQSPAHATPVGALAPVGVQWNAADSDYATMPAKMQGLAASGVREIGMPVSWWYVCGSAGSCNYAQLDRTINAARAAGLQVSLQVNGTPDWLHPDRAGDAPDQRHWMLPRDDAERASLRAFAQELAARYAGKVHRYEWGNEPDLQRFSTTGISPEDYARSLAAFYTGIKAGDGDAIVVSAGLSRASVGFAQRMIDALAALPGAAQNNGYFDELGVHPYSENAPLVHDPMKAFQTQFGITDFNFDGFRRLEQLLDSKGRSGTKLWLSEVGYSTTDTWMKAVSDEQRAMYLLMAADVVRDDPRVDGLMWHSAYASNGVGPEWALIDARGGGAGMAAVKRANAGTSRVSSAPGCSPDVLSGTVTWEPGCFGVDASAVKRTEVFVDGYPQGPVGGAKATWDSARVGAGRHTVTVAFYGDGGPLGYSTPGSVTVARGGDVRVVPSSQAPAPTPAPTQPSPQAPTPTQTPTQSPTPTQPSPQASTSTPTPTQTPLPTPRTDVALSAGPVYTTVQGRRVRFSTTLRSTQPTSVDAVVVAVRDSSGTVVDPALVRPGQVAGTYTYSARRSYAPGTYHARAAVLRGGAWVGVGDTKTFVIR